MTSALVVDCVVVTAAELLCWPLLAAPVQESAFLKGAVACSSVSCTLICAQEHASCARGSLRDVANSPAQRKLRKRWLSGTVGY